MSFDFGLFCLLAVVELVRRLVPLRRIGHRKGWSFLRVVFHKVVSRQGGLSPDGLS